MTETNACQQLDEALAYHLDSRLGRQDAKARVLEALQHRPLANAEVLEITQLSRQQATKLLSELRETGLIALAGANKGARWHLIRETPQ